MTRLADYVLNKVNTRKIPHLLSAEMLKQKPNVVMKLDIEGSELEVLTDLLVTGSLQHVDLVAVEYHLLTQNDKNHVFIQDLEKAIDTITKLTNVLGLKSVINVKPLDDESYGTDIFPLPNCLD